MLETRIALGLASERALNRRALAVTDVTFDTVGCVSLPGAAGPQVETPAITGTEPACWPVVSFEHSLAPRQWGEGWDEGIS